MKIRLQTNGQSTDFCQTGTIMRPNTYEPKEVPIHSRADKQKKESHIPTNNWPAWNNRLYYPRKTIIQCKELQYQKNDKYNVFNHTIYLFSLSLMTTGFYLLQETNPGFYIISLQILRLQNKIVPLKQIDIDRDNSGCIPLRRTS